MNPQSNLIRDYEKTLKVIFSCETEDQDKAAERMVENFARLYPNETSMIQELHQMILKFSLKLA